MTVTINGTTGITSTGGYSGDGISFADNTPSNTLVTDTSGNVGIGTSSPAAKLDVNGSLRLGDGNELDFGGTSTFIIGSSSNNLMRFYTNTAERARIDSSGNLLVGTTASPNGTSAYGSGFELASLGRAILRQALSSTTAATIQSFYNPNGQVGQIQLSGTSTSYVTSSDYRLKENVQPMTGALTTVAALKPCTYTWKTDGSAGQGFIAHELQEVVPDCVTGEKDAVNEDGTPNYQGIDTSFLVATLTAAIQEQQSIIEQLRSDVEALKGN